MKTRTVLAPTGKAALAGALVLLMAPAAFAEFIVVPNANATVAGNGGINTPLRSLDRTLQTVFGASQLTGIPLGSQITGISFRLDEGQLAFPTTAITFPQYNIQVSTSLNAPGALNNTFANNIGPDVVLVRSGPLTLPPNSYVPGPGVDPFGFIIPFTTPFTYTGGNLLITVRLQGSGDGDVFLDGQTNTAGVIQTIGAASFTGPVNDGITGTTSPIFQLQFSAVPEPSTFALFGLGTVGLLAFAWRRRQHTA